MQAEYTLFIILATIILLTFIVGIVVFVFQYHKKKLVHENEKKIINELHTKELLEAQVAIQTQTMQDIGREIHDNIGQHLTLASLYINQMSYESSEENSRVVAVGEIINESLSELRNLSKSLTNSDVDLPQLVRLIENECKRVNDLKMCVVGFTHNIQPVNIPATFQNFVIRILQEFIQNSLKHSNCSQILIEMNFDNKVGLNIKAEDNGNGFELDQEKIYDGIGLANIRHRAILIKSELSFNSTPGIGTVLNLFIPIDKLSGNGK